MPRPLILIHGYSADGLDFKPLVNALQDKGLAAEDINIGNYVSLNNEVTIKDIAEGLDRAFRLNNLLKGDEPFDAIVHSTGMLVIRSWLTNYGADVHSNTRLKRLKHLIGLAPATWGSPQAHKGRTWLGALVKGSRNVGPDFLNAGDQVLDGLELGSQFTWNLAHADLLGDQPHYGTGTDTPYVCVFIGNRPYAGLASVANDPGTDGTVRWAGCALNTRKIVVDLTRTPIGDDGKPTSRVTMTPWADNPTAGACVTCPRRSGYNTSLFSDVTHGDQCLDGSCYQTQITAYLDREIAARPELVQIENGYRSPREKRPGAVQRGHFREIEPIENPDAEQVPACDAAKPAIIVYGKRVGTTLTVCTDNNCPIHDPRAAARLAQQEQENPTPVMTPAAEEETEEEAAQREAAYEQRRKEHQAEEDRRAEERRQQFEREEQEREAEHERRDQLRKQREATFEQMLENAPETFTAAQLRVLLRAIVNLDPYTFADDLSEDIADENDHRSAEEVLLSTIDNTTDDKLTRFALRLALSSHVVIPREHELDFLTEAEAVFAPPQKKAKAKKTRNTPVAMLKPTTQPKKQKTARKQIAA
jgi:pimeloyl-ACP methyl ester carboxylesterase